MDSIPALCPMTRGSSRSRAQRLLPSMMIAMCSGGGNWLTGGSLPLNLHDLGFFAGRHLVDHADVTVSGLLHLVTTAPGLVGRNLLLLFQRLDPVHLLASDIANRDVGTLGVSLDEPGIFPPALLVQGRDGNPDQDAVISRIQPELRLLDRLFDRADNGAIPGLDEDQACFRHADGGQLVERRRVAIVLDRDLVDQRRAGAPGADRHDLLGKGVETLLHFDFGVFDVGLDHDGAPTSVPICLPATTPSRLQSCERSYSLNGMLFSRHSVTAVWSITRRSLLIRSR